MNIGKKQENASNKFHKFLINSNPDDIDIVVTEIKKLDNQQQAEDYEMILLKQDLLAGHKMLNTKKRTKRLTGKAPIPLTTNQKQLTLERFKEIQQGKIKKKCNTFNPTINHSESRQSITVYYRVDKKNNKRIPL